MVSLDGMNLFLGLSQGCMRMWRLRWRLGALLHFFNQVIRVSAKGILHPSTVDVDQKRLCFSHP